MGTGDWLVFGSGHAVTVNQLAALMADTVTGKHDSQIINLFATPLFGDREDLAYLQGSRAIKALDLGPLQIRQLERKFKDALAIHGILGLDGDIHVARFRVYYWSMIVCQTNGTRRQLARKKVKKHRETANRLTDQSGRYATLSQ